MLNHGQIDSPKNDTFLQYFKIEIKAPLSITWAESSGRLLQMYDGSANVKNEDEFPDLNSLSTSDENIYKAGSSEKPIKLNDSASEATTLAESWIWKRNQQSCALCVAIYEGYVQGRQAFVIFYIDVNAGSFK